LYEIALRCSFYDGDDDCWAGSAAATAAAAAAADPTY